MALVGWYSKERRLVAHWTSTWLLFVMVFPALAIGAVFFGLSGGKSGDRPFSRPAEVQVFLKDESKPLEGRVLFVLDGYILLRTKDSGRFVSVARDQVKMLVHRDGA